MLENGLGDLLRDELRDADRLVDLFCGAGSVSWYVATRVGKRVLACDLQQYATTLAAAVIKRTSPHAVVDLVRSWIWKARHWRSQQQEWTVATELDAAGHEISEWQIRAQEVCGADGDEEMLVYRCYGGHYFSPVQALAIDSLLAVLPSDGERRDLCLAATIMAASQCVAAPGHTAQPFKATPTGGRFLSEAWQRDPCWYALDSLKRLCPLYARVRGATVVGSAIDVAAGVGGRDLVFVDPPYSAVHYSRFYHVLETIARRQCGEVEGVGRYPPQSERPRSDFSRIGKSATAMRDLLDTLSRRKCTVILTFPEEECSNGLSGMRVEEMAKQRFRVDRKEVWTRFSTLGGNVRDRAARKRARELILVLKAR